MTNTKVHLNLILGLLFVVATIATAIDLDSGFYSDDYSTDAYLTDAYTINNTVVRRVAEEELQLTGGEADADGEIIYEITRTDASSAGVVQFYLAETASGNGSWVMIGTGSTPGSIAYGNMTNYFEGSSVAGYVRLLMPAGTTTMYVGIMAIWPGEVAWLSSFEASIDGNDFDALATCELTCTRPYTDVYNDDKVLQENYEINGGVVRSPFLGAILVGRNAGDAVKYRFTGSAEAIENAYVVINGTEETSGDGSWLQIKINNLTGANLLTTNLTNLAGGPTVGGTFTLSLIDEIPAIVGETGFELELTNPGPGLTGNARVSMIHVATDLEGDFDSDCVVDLKDLDILLGNWLVSI